LSDHIEPPADPGHDAAHGPDEGLPDVDLDGLPDHGDMESGVDPITAEPESDMSEEIADQPIHGDVESGVDAALSQSESGLCVPASAAMAVTLLTGEETSEGEAVSVAVEMGLLDGEPGDWEGMSTGEAVTLLEEMGVDARLETGDLDDLRAHLDEGDAVILSVDADELWGEGEGDTTADHAVVIVAIDDERGVAIVDDPGVPGGHGVEVPLEDLEDAWEDSGNEMVIAEAGDATSAEPGPFGDFAEGGAARSLVLLPVVLGASARARRSLQYPLSRNENVSGSCQPPT
jgi:hypothetical protein